MTDDDKRLQRIGRLAFRAEGENWNAYYAMDGTMAGAIYLGSVKMALVTERKERKDQFISLMRDCFADVAEKAWGIRPEWKEPVSAPEHERTME